MCMQIYMCIMLQDEVLVRRLERLCDAAVGLESFSGSDKGENPLYQDYHGIYVCIIVVVSLSADLCVCTCVCVYSCTHVCDCMARSSLPRCLPYAWYFSRYDIFTNYFEFVKFYS